MKTTRAAIYLRVSTEDQTVDNQRLELERVVALKGWTVAQVHTDAGISGAKGRGARPGLDAMLRAAARREVDVIVAWSIDRLGRSLSHLAVMLDELRSLGVDLYLHQQAIDTTSPTGKAFLGMAAVFAEFERAMLVERTKAGLARARAQGKRLGRPPVSASVVRRILKLRQQGKGIHAIRHELGLGTSTVQRVVAAAAR